MPGPDSGPGGLTCADFARQRSALTATLVISLDSLLDYPRNALRTSIKSQFWKIWSTVGDECPQNGSGKEPTAPRTTLG